MLEHIDPTAQEALSALENASDLQTLDQARVRYLGVNGQFTALLKQMGSLPKEDRPKAGVQINQAKKKLEALGSSQGGAGDGSSHAFPGNRRSIRAGALSLANAIP